MSSAQELKTSGNQAFKAKEYEKAIELWSQSLELNPTDHSLLSNRSAAYFNLHKFEEALQDASKCIEVNPTFIKGFMRKGFSLEKLGKHQEALESFEEGLKLDSEHKELKQGVERCQAHLGGGFDINQLLQNPMVQDLIQKNPQLAQQIISNPQLLQNPQMMQMMMSMFNQQKQQQGQQNTPQSEPTNQQNSQFQPENQFQQPPQRPPSPPKQPQQEPQQEPQQKQEPTVGEFDKTKKEADQNYMKKDFNKAIEIYQKCVDLDSQKLIPRTNMATCYMELKNYEKALEILDEAKKVYEETDFNERSFVNFAKVLEKKGRVLYLQGKFDEAIEQYEKSLLENNVGRVNAALRELKREKKKKEELAYINPELSNQHREKGNEYFKQQKYPEAIKEYEEAQKRNPQDPKNYNNLCSGFIKLMRFNDAKKCAEKVLELEPSNLKAKLRIAAIHNFSKEHHKAMDIYKQILESDPNNIDAKKGLQDTQQKIYSSMNSGTDEERVQRAMQDPEIQAIMMDPMVRIALEQMQTNPQKSMEYMQDKTLGPKIQRLIEAGVLKVG